MTKRDEYIERQIVIGFIVSTEFIQQIIDNYKKDYLESQEAQLIVGWCLDYFRAYDKAPLSNIEKIYYEKSKRLDEDQCDFIEGILDTISEEYEQIKNEFNVQYLVDKTIEYFQIRAHAILADELKISVSNYDSRRGEELLNAHNLIDVKLDSTARPFTDTALISQAFKKAETPLFAFPGSMGDMINEQLVSGNFIGIMGSEKKGKSWLLMEFVLRSVRKGVPTALFQAGDMDDEDMTARIHIRLARRSTKEKYCGRLYIPVLDCKYNQDNSCTKDHRTCDIGLLRPITYFADSNNQKQRSKTDTDRSKAQQSSNEATMLSPEEYLDQNPDYIPCKECYRDNPVRFKGSVYWEERPKCNPLTEKEAIEQGKRFHKLWKSEPFISTHPTSTLTVSKIKAVIDKWERLYGFTPKVIVIDYADIMASENSKLDERGRQNDVWKSLRGLAIERKCLIVTATQTDAGAYEKHTIGLQNFSEDKRKYAHVTGMLGLNQTPREKELGIMRINYLLARNDSFDSSRCVNLLQCLQTGQPLIATYYK